MAQINPLTGGLHWPEETKTTETETKNAARDLNADFSPMPSILSLDERYELCMSVGEEVIESPELRALLTRKESPICYDGFEPSGRMHIAQGLLRSINVNKLTKAGCVFKFWIADWFAMLNNKLGGDIEKIRDCGRYFVEIWKATGMDMSNVQFLWASDEINNDSDKYWRTVMDVARANNLPRIKRCGTIMGREDTESMPSAQIMYPCMQCTDVFFLKADICQLGMDQKKVNMLAREYCDHIKQTEKPVIIGHHMLMGLKEGQAKMSKSDPDSAIFMEDTAQDVKRKISKAFCPPGVVADNPILDYAKHIIFGLKPELTVKRKPENGGDATYTTYAALEEDFKTEKLHPGDLKPSVIDAINEFLEPVRVHFDRDPYAKQLLQRVRSFQITR